MEQINTHPCKMTLVTLRAAQSKLLKVREVFIQDNLFFKFIGKNYQEYKCQDIFLVLGFITF